jgi:phage tail protein X
MGEDPRTIRHEIEDTRERMGDTVDALAYKADVKTRAKESVSEKVTSVKEKITGAKDSVSESTPGGEDVKEGARKAVGVAQTNPLGLAIGSVAVGFVAGLLVPATRVEDEKLGPVADQVKERAAETGRQALDHGRQVAQDVADQAKETAKESGQEHAQAVASDARQGAQEAREQVS